METQGSCGSLAAQATGAAIAYPCAEAGYITDYERDNLKDLE